MEPVDETLAPSIGTKRGKTSEIRLNDVFEHGHCKSSGAIRTCTLE